MVPDPLALILLAAAAIAQLDRDTAHSVRSLPVRDAQTARRVHLSGVVTFCPPPHRYFHLQDETAGIRVECRGDQKLNAGDRVEVWGTTTGGTFLPEVSADKVLARERNQLAALKPAPYHLALDDSGYLDGQWVEVEAVVQRAWPDKGWIKVEMARGRGHGTALLLDSIQEDARAAARLRGAVVRVRGVCVASTRDRLVIGPPRLFVTDRSKIEVVRPPDDPRALPLTQAGDLPRFRPDPIEARLPVRVSGTVTLEMGGKQLFLQDETGVVQAFYPEQVAARTGQRVTVVGFPRLGTDPPRLENAQVTIDAPPGPLPGPLPGTVADAAAGRLDGRVVRFTGTVLDAGPQSGWPCATVVANGISFTVVFLDSDAAVEPGSRVEVVGVATRQALDKFRPHTFALVVRPGGLRVLEGPPAPVIAPAPGWWTGRRVAYLSAGFVGLFLVGGAGATVMRLQVRRATALVRKQYEEKEKLEGQLKLAAKLEAAGRLAGSIAHDFNNLLTVINGCAFLLEKEIAGDNDPAQTAKFATAIRRAGDQSAALTSQLLLFSRQRTITPHPLDLNETVGHVLDILERLLGDRITVRLAPGVGLPLALAEPGQLSQVLLNLAVNAADAMPGGGTFTLTTSAPEPGWVRFAATDTGTGMSDEVKEHMFERGFTTKPADKGTGLGLSTVYGIVQRLGGRIRFFSELGRGTTFEIDLPAAQPAQALPPPLAPAAAVARGGSGTSAALPSAVVLLAEDEPEVCALFRYVLEGAGLTVLAAGSADAALRLLAAHRGALDLLVTDVVLPGLSGRQLADVVRARHPGARVLFMSGYTADEIAQQGITEEQVEFLHKPCLPRELLERVAQLLARPA